MTEVDCELICKCGVRFRCPRCDAVPQLRIASTSLVDRRGRTEHVELHEALPSNAEAAGPHRFAVRQEPTDDDDPEVWLSLERAADLIAMSHKSFTMSGATLASHIRRKRIGRSFHWFKPDLQALAEIREQCDLSLDAALRTYAALVEGRL